MKNFIRSRKHRANFINFFQSKQEEEARFLNLGSHLMFPQSTHGCFGGVKLKGRNAGATMVVRQGCSGESQDCCSINIYISNNVQGVNNSVLIGSKVKQGNPGVYLSLKGLKLDRGIQKTSKKKTSELELKYQSKILATLLFPVQIIHCNIRHKVDMDCPTKGRLHMLISGLRYPSFASHN